MNLPAAHSAFSQWKRWLAVAAAGLCMGLPASRAAAQIPAAIIDATQVGAPRLDLAADWRVHAGDDPAYARPDFDDSHWTPFNAATDSLHTLFPHAEPTIVWYRIHLKVRPDDKDLALRARSISNAFVVFTDGIPLIQEGSVAPFVPYNTYGWITRNIPPDQTATGLIVIAVRVRLSGDDWGRGQPGLMDWKLSLGDGLSLLENSWLQISGMHLADWLNDCLFLCLMLGALLLYFAQRSQAEYLWLAMLGLVSLLFVPLDLYTYLHVVPTTWAIFAGVTNDLLGTYVGARMYLAFARRPLGWRLHAYLVLASVLNAATDLYFYASTKMTYSGGWMTTANIETLLSAPALVLFSVIIPVLMIVQARRGNREAGILLVPLLLTGILNYVGFGAWLLEQIPSLRSSAWALIAHLDYVPVGPFSPSLYQVLSLLSLLSLALIILLRTARTSRSEALLETELANARAVQQLILPDQAETVPGFAIESIYAPAQQVGGDFFQALPAGDGGLLLVVGDVAGKGLPAAMLVSLLVGAIRTVAAYSHEPAEVLARLNEQLLGSANGGFSTALAIFIGADGAARIANAGHLPPYLDGQEIESSGALPLGIDKGVRYETARLRLMPDSRLTFYSDGVIEARNERGELLGFERGKTLSTQPAAAIAAAAKAFGQEDDITVVIIRRTASAISAMRAEAALSQPPALEPVS